MGYPMTYDRVVNRNLLTGDYIAETIWENTEPMASVRRLISGDLRRLETDTRDSPHLQRYALYSGATVQQVKAIFDAFFAGNIPIPKEEPHGNI